MLQPNRHIELHLATSLDGTVISDGYKHNDGDYRTSIDCSFAMMVVIVIMKGFDKAFLSCLNDSAIINVP